MTAARGRAGATGYGMRQAQDGGHARRVRRVRRLRLTCLKCGPRPGGGPGLLAMARAKRRMEDTRGGSGGYALPVWYAALGPGAGRGYWLWHAPSAGWGTRAAGPAATPRSDMLPSARGRAGATGYGTREAQDGGHARTCAARTVKTLPSRSGTAAPWPAFAVHSSRPLFFRFSVLPFSLLRHWTAMPFIWHAPAAHTLRRKRVGISL